MKILIVEDNPIIAMDLEDELSDRGFDPISAATVKDARNLFATKRPSFAFLDMHLRTDTSFDLAREFRAQGVPFAFLSGNDASSLPEDLRASKILTKPINFNDLITIIAETGESG